MEQHEPRRRAVWHQRSRRSLLIRFAAPLLIVAATISSEPAANADQRPRGVVCSYVAPPPSADYCDRIFQDRLQRMTTPDGQTAVHENVVKGIQRAAEYGGWCPTPDHETCFKRPLDHAPTSSDVAASRSALAAEGFRDTIVRLSKTHDPAPEAALVYAVRIGNVCVVGFAMTVPRGTGEAQVVGMLPGKRCLRR